MSDPNSTASLTPQEMRIHSRRWYTLAVLCLSLVLIVAGNSSLNVALPDISERLGSSPTGLQWIVNIYGLVFAGLLLPAGALADRYGRKTALQGGLLVFALAAFAASFGTATWHLIVARGFMGLGAAFIMPGTLSILANVFKEPADRRKAISIWAGFAGLGGALGTVLSGLLLINSTWSSTFMINAPIALLALITGLWLVPNSSDPKDAVLDPLGVVLAISGTGALIFSIIEAPVYGFLDPKIIGVGAVAIVLLAGFAWWELHTDHPMLDVRLFRQRGFSIGSSTIALQFMAMFGLYFAVTQYLQLGHGYSALESAMIGLPVGIFALIGAPISGMNVGRFGARAVVASGLLISGSGLVLLGLTASPTVSVAMLLLGLSMVGLGNGQTTAPSTTLIMNSVPRAKAGVGSAVNDLSRETGGALGIALFGSIMNIAYQNDIASRLANFPEPLRKQAQVSIVAAFEAAGKMGKSGRSADAALIVEQAKAAFSHAFGRTMLYASIIIFINAAIVWKFQHRHESVE
ncbi:MAG: MFS transporter [Microthrixaceae bacterium]|nr:MFS transporter [Microthrixaceae bacterium]